MDAVAEYRARPKQPRAVIDVEATSRAWKKPGHELDLGRVLVEMSLDISLREFARQGARGLQLSLARCDREARRDRIVEPPASPPALDQRLAFVIAALSRIGQRLGRVAVHHRLASDHPRAATLRRGEKGVDRLRMDRAIDHCGRRAAADEFVEKEFRDPRAMAGIGEFLLLDERVVMQPVQQLRAIGADDLGLRIVDVSVDEARHHEAARVIVDRRALRSPRENVARLADRLHAPVGDQNRPVLEINSRGSPRFRWIVPEGEDASADDSRSHVQDRMSLRRSAAIRSISARAVLISVSESSARRRSKAARMSALLLPFTAMMKGKPKRAR